MNKQRSQNRLRAELSPPAQLDLRMRSQMWALYGRHFDGVSRLCFERDLENKHHVVVLRDRRHHILRGFCTLRSSRHRVAGRSFTAVFTGDTIIDRHHRGGRALATAFFFYLLRAKLKRPLEPVYWFLVSKGYKTYLTMSRNFVHYHPRKGQPTPRWEALVLDHLGREYGKVAWNKQSGVVEHGDGCPRLKPGVAELEHNALQDPDVRFFLHANPLHRAGHELAVIGRVDLWLVGKFILRCCQRLTQDCLGAWLRIRPRARKSRRA